MTPKQDIVDRLREHREDYTEQGGSRKVTVPVCMEAADEIEELRGRLVYKSGMVGRLSEENLRLQERIEELRAEVEELEHDIRGQNW